MITSGRMVTGESAAATSNAVRELKPGDPAGCPDGASAPVGAAEGPAAARSRFVARVVEAFESVDADYVLLHGYGPDCETDSDLDLAVARRSLRRVDRLLRSCALGRLVQRLDYDIPWCRLYVLETDEPGRRYRHLDIACDPWGLGRYGPAIPIALRHVRRTVSGRVTEPGAETAYLAVKRACKGFGRLPERSRLAEAYRRDPVGAAELLACQFGGAGRELARTLGRSEADLDQKLEHLRMLVRRRRRSPSILLRRVAFAIARAWRRFARPTGLVVAVVGPDGVGKSSLAAGLEEALAGAFRRATRLHLGPGLLPPPARLLGRPPSDGREPHGRPPSRRIGSAARLTYLWLDALVGWLPRMAVPRRRATLVLLERGWLDLAIDPLRYRLSLPPAAVLVLGRLLPRPDLVLLLDAAPEEIHLRKPELTAREIDRQLRAWRALGARSPHRFAALDASLPLESVIDEAVRRVDDYLASRLAGRAHMTSGSR